MTLALVPLTQVTTPSFSTEKNLNFHPGSPLFYLLQGFLTLQIDGRGQAFLALVDKNF